MASIRQTEQTIFLGPRPHSKRSLEVGLAADPANSENFDEAVHDLAISSEFCGI